MKKISVLWVSPFPPPYGGIAGFSRTLLDSPLNRAYRLMPFDTARADRFRNLDRTSGQRNYGRILRPGHFRFIAAVLFSFAEFVRTVVSKKPDLIHVHTCSFWGFIRSGGYLFLGRMLGRKTILHLHNAIDRFYFQETKNETGRRIIRAILNLPHQNIALSEGIARRIRPLTRKPVVPVYNAVDTGAFRHDPRRARNRCGFVFTGAVGEQKGAWDILAAIRLMTAADQRLVKMTFIGRGETEKGRRLASERGLKADIRFAGILGEAEKNRALAESDAFILPSHGEGQPISILEAMASGLPVISTRVGTIPEIILEGVNGFLTEPGDSEALKNSMIRLIRSEGLRRAMGRRNAAAARKNHDVSRLVSDIDAVYRSVSAEPG